MCSVHNGMSNSTALIPGGYYIVPRWRLEIRSASPVTREIYDYLLAQANYEDRESNGRTIKRGQCVRTYEDIQEGLVWYIGYRKMKYSKDQIENALKWLRKHEMIATEKTTRGMIITLVNYDFYQTPANYENHRQDQKKTVTDPQHGDTINNEFEEEENTLPGLSTRLPDFFYKSIMSINSEESTYTTQYLRSEFNRCCMKAGKKPYYRRKIYGREIRKMFSQYNMNFAHIINFIYYYFDCRTLDDDYVVFFDCFNYASINDYKQDWSEVKHLYGHSEIPVTHARWWRSLYD